MGIVSIDIQLSVEVKDDMVFAHLLVNNNTTDQLNLDKIHLCFNGKFMNNVFEIVDSKGNKASYSGVMIKRSVRPEDFILLKKGEKMMITINLSDGYKLEKGKKYIIQYDTFNPGFTNDEDLMEMRSNKVVVLY